MASAELSRRVGKVVGYPPLVEMSLEQRREFHEVLLEADDFEDLPGKWQAAILKAEAHRPTRHVVTGDQDAGSPPQPEPLALRVLSLAQRQGQW
jgi:hypothetical protein